MDSLFSKERHNFFSLETIAKDFVNNVFEARDRKTEKRIRMLEDDAIADLQEARHSAYEIKEGLARRYRGRKGFLEDLHPSDVHILEFNKKDNSILYKIGAYVQREYVDLIIGWD